MPSTCAREWTAAFSATPRAPRGGNDLWLDLVRRRNRAGEFIPHAPGVESAQAADAHVESVHANPEPPGRFVYFRACRWIADERHQHIESRRVTASAKRAPQLRECPVHHRLRPAGVETDIIRAGCVVA
jgi:hypothetical protein